MRIFCPNCNSEFQVSATFVYKRGRCPKCKQVFTITKPPEDDPEDELVDLDPVEKGEDGPAPPASATAEVKWSGSRGAGPETPR